VNELAASLELTDNAVRTHLSGLERDGLVEQEGLRRAGGKPSFVYRLTDSAESLFPKGYAAILDSVLARLRSERGEEGLQQFMRAAGREAGAQQRIDSTEMRDRVDGALQILINLGALAEVEETEDEFIIRGFSCPLGSIVGRNPEACALAEELIAAATNTEVRECCERAENARCMFRIRKNR
jgi:predicted ArsR family transcriptional regulator